MAVVRINLSNMNSNLRRKRHQSPYFATTKKVRLVATFGLVMTCLLYFRTKVLPMKMDSHYVRCNILSTLKKDEIAKLEEIDLKDCQLREIPSSIQYATSLRKLDVSNNEELSTLPNELEYCKALDILFASNCPSMQTLPSVLGRTNISRLGWRSGSLTYLDPNGIPPNIVHFILTNNQIETIDGIETFTKLRNVRKLMLSHNKISSFGGGTTEGGGLEQLISLELLRLAGNNLNEIPSQIWELPKLTWLTISGNPAVINNPFQIQQQQQQQENDAALPKLPSITWNDLKSLGNDLGEGASGKVGLYEWQGKHVAVKIIHGVTSDGTAEDELSIYHAIGSDGLVDNRVVGCIALLSDEERKGIVMEPLPRHMEDFALAPTIVTVTEDRWEEGLTLSASFVKNALNDASLALSFIHSKGISHGDFYAHNIKVDKDTGHLFLLDFGASFFKGETYSKQMEQIEVRSYGVFVGEMISMLDKKENQLHQKLQTLFVECINPIVSKRPLFANIQTTVRNL